MSALILALTPEEAAKALGVGRTTIYRLMREGALRSFAIGRSRRIPVEALAEFVRAQTPGAEAPGAADLAAHHQVKAGSGEQYPD